MKSILSRFYLSVHIRGSRLIIPTDKPKVVHSKINGYKVFILNKNAESMAYKAEYKNKYFNGLFLANPNLAYTN